MSVDLSRSDVGVAEHLLERSQIAASGEQVRGEAVPERVRTHARVEPRGARVTLDDLVETLAREALTAHVDEHARFVVQADEPRAALLQVGAQRGHRLGADRHEALLGALTAGPQDRGLGGKVRLELSWLLVGAKDRRQFFDIEEKEMQRFLLKLLNDPEKFLAHVRWQVARLY